MRKLILVAALALLGTSAHAGPSRGLVLAATQSTPAAAPAASATQTAQAAPAQTAPATPLAAQTQAPAKPDRAQAIFEQLIKHGVIKLPNQTPAAATTAPATAPAVATAPAPVATPAAPAPAAVAQPAPAPVATAPVAAAPVAPVAKVAVATTSEPKKMSQAETRIRAELRRHGIR